MFLLIDVIGLFLAAALAFAVWGPDIWRWIARQFGTQSSVEHRSGSFHLD